MSEHDSPLRDVDVVTTDRTYANAVVDLYDHYVHVWTDRHESDTPAEVIVPATNVKRIES